MLGSLLICLHTSNPSRSGILRSSITTSGSNVCNILPASKPLLAVPTSISMPAFLATSLTISARDSATSGWSSTTRTRLPRPKSSESTGMLCSLRNRIRFSRVMRRCPPGVLNVRRIRLFAQSRIVSEDTWQYLAAWELLNDFLGCMTTPKHLPHD